MSTQVRMRYLYDVIDDRAGDRRPPLLSVSIHDGVVPRSSMTEDEHRADDLTNYKVVGAGDIVINRMRAFQGAVGQAPSEGLVSPDYLVLRLDPSLNARFFHHLFRSRWFVSEMTSRLRGIGSVGQGNVRTPRINVDDLGEISIAVPSATDQRRIAAFLDAETERIDQLIVAKTRMIDVLRERSAAGWDQVFATEGAGWAQSSLRYVLDEIVDTKHATPSADPDGEYLVIRTPNVKDGKLVIPEDSKWCDRATYAEWTERATPRAGDVVLTREAPAGEACVLPELPVGCIGQRTVLLRPNHLIEPEWVVRAIYSTRVRDHIRLVSNSTTVAHINMADLPGIPIPLPSREVQRQILDRLHKFDASVLESVDLLTQQVELLAERRRSLIAATVTGEMAIP